MKVFISGVAGFLGSHLADAHTQRGDQVVGCDNMIGGDLQNLPEGIEFQEADCVDVNAMKEMLAGVAHRLSLCRHRYRRPERLFAHDNRQTRPREHRWHSCGCGESRCEALRLLLEHGAIRKPESSFHEDQAPMPDDPYGIAKFAGELLVANVCDTHGMEYVIAVPHNIIGPRQKYDDPYRNVASIMINRMLQGKQPIIYGDGEQVRCFSFVQDCVDPLLKMGTQPGLSGEVINIGPDEGAVTINQLAKIIAKLLSFDLHPIYVASRPQEVRDARCSADKARRLLGYRTKVSLEDGLRSMINWIREHGPKPFEYHLPIEIDSPLVPPTWRDDCSEQLRASSPGKGVTLAG